MLSSGVFPTRGPNLVWHTDKLKTNGIAISGCIDDYSRKITGYYMDAVIHSGGCPERFGLDHSTETIYVNCFACPMVREQPKKELHRSRDLSVCFYFQKMKHIQLLWYVLFLRGIIFKSDTPSNQL